MQLNWTRKRAYGLIEVGEQLIVIKIHLFHWRHKVRTTQKLTHGAYQHFIIVGKVRKIQPHMLQRWFFPHLVGLNCFHLHQTIPHPIAQEIMTVCPIAIEKQYQRRHPEVGVPVEVMVAMPVTTCKTRISVVDPHSPCTIRDLAPALDVKTTVPLLAVVLVEDPVPGPIIQPNIHLVKRRQIGKDGGDNRAGKMETLMLRQIDTLVRVAMRLAVLVASPLVCTQRRDPPSDLCRPHTPEDVLINKLFGKVIFFKLENLVSYLFIFWKNYISMFWLCLVTSCQQGCQPFDH